MDVSWQVASGNPDYRARRAIRGLRRDTLTAWEEFRDTGLHATAEEVDRWLTGWGTEDELPAPECHE